MFQVDFLLGQGKGFFNRIEKGIIEGNDLFYGSIVGVQRQFLKVLP